MAIEDWQVSRIDDVKKEIDNNIKLVERFIDMASEIPHLVAPYDGKVWKRSIEDAINDKLITNYKSALEPEYDKYDKYTFKASLYHGPRYLPLYYKAGKCEEKRYLYTDAGNYRIDVKDWQQQTDNFCQTCNGIITKMQSDKNELENIVNEYNYLLEKSDMLTRNIYPPIIDMIKGNNIFYQPLSHLYK